MVTVIAQPLLAFGMDWAKATDKLEPSHNLSYLIAIHSDVNNNGAFLSRSLLLQISLHDRIATTKTSALLAILGRDGSGNGSRLLSHFYEEQLRHWFSNDIERPITTARFPSRSIPYSWTSPWSQRELKAPWEDFSLASGPIFNGWKPSTSLSDQWLATASARYA